MATLGLKEMGKFLWEGGEKSRLSQFSFAKLRQPTGQTFFPTFPKQFPISLQPKVAIAEFFWKLQRKTWYSILEKIPGVPGGGEREGEECDEEGEKQRVRTGVQGGWLSE